MTIIILLANVLLMSISFLNISNADFLNTTLRFPDPRPLVKKLGLVSDYEAGPLDNSRLTNRNADHFNTTENILCISGEKTASMVE